MEKKTSLVYRCRLSSSEDLLVGLTSNWNFFFVCICSIDLRSFQRGTRTDCWSSIVKTKRANNSKPGGRTRLITRLWINRDKVVTCEVVPPRRRRTVMCNYLYLLVIPECVSTEKKRRRSSKCFPEVQESPEALPCTYFGRWPSQINKHGGIVWK